MLYAGENSGVSSSSRSRFSNNDAHQRLAPSGADLGVTFT